MDISPWITIIHKIYFPNLLWCKNSLILESKSFKNTRSLKLSDVFTFYKFYHPSWRGFSSSRDEWANKFPGLTKPWPTFSSDRAAITFRYPAAGIMHVENGGKIDNTVTNRITSSFSDSGINGKEIRRFFHYTWCRNVRNHRRNYLWKCIIVIIHL